ncbi:MAG: hypothetical protein JKY65_06250 [Planctomycetes bacterium]|nr:hypothetical protein [Planctomycetota bacterium]
MKTAVMCVVLSYACLLASASQAWASPPSVKLELPSRATHVSERAALEEHVETVFAARPGRVYSTTTKRRLAFDFVRTAEGVSVLKARRLAPRSRVRMLPPPGAIRKAERLVEQTLPSEGKQITLDRDRGGKVLASVGGAIATVHSALTWPLAHSLQALLPKEKVTVGTTWSAPLGEAAPALLGAQAWGRIAHLKITKGTLEAELKEAAHGGKAVVGLTLKLTFAAPVEQQNPGWNLDATTSLEAQATLTLERGALQLSLAGKLKIQRHYSHGAAPTSKEDKTDSEIVIDRSLNWQTK